MDKLDEWYNSISSIRKIDINEAKELYKKSLNVESKEDKKLILNEIVIGTLYVVCNYIRKNCMDVFMASGFDMDDVINAFNEVWIKKIYEGKLLNIDMYSDLIDNIFLDEVYESLGGTEIFFKQFFGFSVNDFKNYFMKYVELKNNDSNPNLLIDEIDKQYPLINYSVTYDKALKGDRFAFMKDKNVQKKRKNLIKFIPIFERIYDNLNLDEDSTLDISTYKISKYFKFIMSSYLLTPFIDNIPFTDTVEDEVIKKVDNEKFMEIVDSLIKNDKGKQIIHERYGFDDEGALSLQKTARRHHVTKKDIELIESRTLSKLKDNESIKEFRK